MRRISNLLALSLLILPTTVQAQSAPPSYEDAIRCANIFTLFAGTADDPKGTEAKGYEETGTQWLTYAILLGKVDEPTATKEFEQSLDALMKKLESLPSEQAVTDFLIPHAGKCVDTQPAMQAALDSYTE